MWSDIATTTLPGSDVGTCQSSDNLQIVFAELSRQDSSKDEGKGRVQLLQWIAYAHGEGCSGLGNHHGWPAPAMDNVQGLNAEGWSGQ